MDAIVFARLYSLNVGLDHVLDDLTKLEQAGLADSVAVQKFRVLAEEMRTDVKRAAAHQLLSASSASAKRVSLEINGLFGVFIPLGAECSRR